MNKWIRGKFNLRRLRWCQLKSFLGFFVPQFQFCPQRAIEFVIKVLCQKYLRFPPSRKYFHCLTLRCVNHHIFLYILLLRHLVIFFKLHIYGQTPFLKTLPLVVYFLRSLNTLTPLAPWTSSTTSPLGGTDDILSRSWCLGRALICCPKNNLLCSSGSWGLEFGLCCNFKVAGSWGL